MDLTWIDVAGDAVKIGLPALITAVAGVYTLLKTKDYDQNKENKSHFYKLQDERKLKYLELLVQSQELVQRYTDSRCDPDSEVFLKYLRAFNEVQIISNDEIRASAFELYSAVQGLIFLRKDEQEKAIIVRSSELAKGKIPYFQKITQEDVTKCYQKGKSI